MAMGPNGHLYLLEGLVNSINEPLVTRVVEVDQQGDLVQVLVEPNNQLIGSQASFGMIESPSTAFEITVDAKRDAIGVDFGFRINEAPVIAPIGDQYAIEGNAFSLQVSATDINKGDGITYSLGSQSPIGASIDAVTGLLQWTPPDSTIEPVEITVIATDAGAPNLSSTATVRIFVQNQNPIGILSNDGPRNEGSIATVQFHSLTDPSAIDAASLRFAYDLGDDGTIDVGSLSYISAVSESYYSFIAIDNPERVVRGYVLDKDGGISSYVSTVSVTNIAPTLNLGGDRGAEMGASLQFQLAAVDPSTIDQASLFMYHIDWESDGIIDEVISASSQAAINHHYQSPGRFVISAFALDKDGGQSTTPTWGVDISGFMIIPNSQDPSLSDLLGHGSSGDDHVEFIQVDSTTVQVRWLTKNGQPVELQQTFVGVTGSILFDAGFGDDSIDASLITEHAALIFGGEGNDFLSGTSRNDSLSGGDGQDTIFGNLGNDLLYGDEGDDLLYGENDEADPPSGYLYGSDTISGGAGNDSLHGDCDGGEGAADLLSGDDGNDIIHGDGEKGSKVGRDTIGGGGGNDVITADGSEGSQDLIYGDGGDDIIDTGGGNDIAFGNAGNDVLLGGDGGEGADDQLFGGEGRDILIGDGGVSKLGQRVGGLDVVDGGAGEDIVLGGVYLPSLPESIGLIQLERLSNRDFAARVQNISGQGSGPRFNGLSFLQLGTNTFNDRTATTTSTLVDVVLGGGDADWLLFDQTYDVSSDIEPIDLIGGLTAWPLPPTT